MKRKWLSSYRSKIRIGFLCAAVFSNFIFLLFFISIQNEKNDIDNLNRHFLKITTLNKLHLSFDRLFDNTQQFLKSGNTSFFDNMLRESQHIKAQLVELNNQVYFKEIEFSKQRFTEVIDSNMTLLEKASVMQASQGTSETVAFLSNSIYTSIAKQYHTLYERYISEIQAEVRRLENNILRDSNQRDINFWILFLFFNGLNFILFLILHGLIKKQEARGFFLEDQVREKAVELNAIYERITDAFVALDNDWNYTYVNQRAADLMGKSVSEVVGKNIWTLFPDVVHEPFYKALHEAKDSRQSRRLELYFSKTGEWFEDLIYPDENGISVYYHDITEKKKSSIALQESEASLKKSNDQFNLVSKATNDALWDWDMITDALSGNAFFYELIDAPLDTVVPRTKFISCIHLEDQPRVLLNIENAVKEELTYWSDEFRFHIHDGTYRSMYNRSYILFNDQGQPARMVGAMQDITNLKFARQQLQLEKELSDSIINSLPGVFYLVNKQGKIFRWNDNFTEISGYSNEEIANMMSLDFFDHEEQALIMKKINSVFINGEDFVEAHFLTKDKRKIPYYFNGVRINYEGEFCLAGLGIDITEKVKANEELRELATHLQHIRENERTNIAREIHDELGQQLTGLKMDMSWLSRKIGTKDPLLADKVNETLGLIDETVKTVRRISTQLRPSILDDLGLVAAMEWQSEEFEKRSEISTRFTSNLTSLSLPPDMATAFFRIFQESLTNVSRHAQASQVEASLQLTDGYLILQIHDNGRGFNIQEIKEKRTLGLLGMKERTLLMGGTYDIVSKPGEGTFVDVRVPFPKQAVI